MFALSTSPIGLSKISAEAFLDVAKTVVAEHTKDHVKDGFAEGVGFLLTEIAKAGTGVFGKILIHIIFDQFDSTKKRLRRLEARVLRLEEAGFRAAVRKLERAQMYPVNTPEEAAFRQQLVHEARSYFEETIQRLDKDNPLLPLINLGIIGCCLETPGAGRYGEQVAEPMIRGWRNEAACHRRLAAEHASKALCFEKKVKDGDIDTTWVELKPAVEKYVPRADDYIQIRPAVYGPRETLEGVTGSAKYHRSEQAREEAVARAKDELADSFLSSIMRGGS